MCLLVAELFFVRLVAEEGSAAAMAVTAAPTRRVNPVAWMSSREQLKAGCGRHRNRFLRWSLVFTQRV